MPYPRDAGSAPRRESIRCESFRPVGAGAFIHAWASFAPPRIPPAGTRRKRGSDVDVDVGSAVLCGPICQACANFRERLNAGLRRDWVGPTFLSVRIRECGTFLPRRAASISFAEDRNVLHSSCLRDPGISRTPDSSRAENGPQSTADPTVKMPARRTEELGRFASAIDGINRMSPGKFRETLVRLGITTASGTLTAKYSARDGKSPRANGKHRK